MAIHACNINAVRLFTTQKEGTINERFKIEKRKEKKMTTESVSRNQTNSFDIGSVFQNKFGIPVYYKVGKM